MAKNLSVAIELDRGPSRAETERFRADQKRLGEQLLTDAEIQERAQRELTKRTNAEKIKAAADAADAQKKAAAEAAEAARQAAEAEKRARREATQAARDALAEAKRVAREKIQAEKEAANAAKKAAKERAEAEREANKALKEASAEWQRQADGATGAALAAGSFVTQMVGLNSALSIVGAITGQIDQSRRSLLEAVMGVQEYRHSLLELAALKGMLGGTTPALAEEVAFRAKTLQGQEAARVFQETALGVGESAIDNAFGQRNISRDEFKKAMELGGAFQATEGGDATAHGQLVGLIPTLAGKGKHMTGEDVFTKESQLFKIFQPGGATFSSLANQYAKLAPLIQSGVYKDTEAAALLSAFSTTNREGAGENVQQFTRATLGGIGRKGVPRVEGAEAVGKYLKSLGVNEQFIKHTKASDLPFAIADKISEDMLKHEAASQTKGEKFNSKVYLTQRGFMNMEDAAALLQYHGLRTSGQWEGSFRPLAQDQVAKPAAADAKTRIAESRRTDLGMQARQAALSEELSKLSVGAGTPEALTNLRRLAFARRKQRGEESYGSYEEVANLSSWDPSEILFRHRSGTEREARRILVEEANKLGVRHDDLFERTLGDKGPDFTGEAGLIELMRRNRAAGGQGLPGIEAVNIGAARALENAGRFEQGLPPVMPPAAVQAPMAPAAAVAAPRAIPGVAGDPGGQPMNREQGERLIKGIDQLNKNLAGGKEKGAPVPRPMVEAPPVARR